MVCEHTIPDTMKHHCLQLNSICTLIKVYKILTSLIRIMIIQTIITINICHTEYTVCIYNISTVVKASVTEYIALYLGDRI